MARGGAGGGSSRAAFPQRRQAVLSLHPSGTAGLPWGLKPSFPSIVSVPALPPIPWGRESLKGPNFQKCWTPASLLWEQIRDVRSAAAAYANRTRPRPCCGVLRQALSTLLAIAKGRGFVRRGSQGKPQKCPAEQRLNPAWQRDAPPTAQADPKQRRRGRPSTLPNSPASPRPSPGPLLGKARGAAPQALPPPAPRGTNRDPACGCGCPSARRPWHFIRREVRLRAAGGHRRCRRVPHLTLVRETPALSPLGICFQLLIQETHVLSVYLEKNE